MNIYKYICYIFLTFFLLLENVIFVYAKDTNLLKNYFFPWNWSYCDESVDKNSNYNTLTKYDQPLNNITLSELDLYHYCSYWNVFMNDNINEPIDSLLDSQELENINKSKFYTSIAIPWTSMTPGYTNVNYFIDLWKDNAKQIPWTSSYDQGTITIFLVNGNSEQYLDAIQNWSLSLSYEITLLDANWTILKKWIWNPNPFTNPQYNVSATGYIYNFQDKSSIDWNLYNTGTIGFWKNIGVKISQSNWLFYQKLVFNIKDFIWSYGSESTNLVDKIHLNIWLISNGRFLLPNDQKVWIYDCWWYSNFDFRKCLVPWYTWHDLLDPWQIVPTTWGIISFEIWSYMEFDWDKTLPKVKNPLTILAGGSWKYSINDLVTLKKNCNWLINKSQSWCLNPDKTLLGKTMFWELFENIDTNKWIAFTDDTNPTDDNLNPAWSAYSSGFVRDWDTELTPDTNTILWQGFYPTRDPNLDEKFPWPWPWPYWPWLYDWPYNLQRQDALTFWKQIKYNVTYKIWTNAIYFMTYDWDNKNEGNNPWIPSTNSSIGLKFYSWTWSRDINQFTNQIVQTKEPVSKNSCYNDQFILDSATNRFSKDLIESSFQNKCGWKFETDSGEEENIPAYTYYSIPVVSWNNETSYHYINLYDLYLKFENYYNNNNLWISPLHYLKDYFQFDNDLKQYVLNKDLTVQFWIHDYNNNGITPVNNQLYFATNWYTGWDYTPPSIQDVYPLKTSLIDTRKGWLLENKGVSFNWNFWQSWDPANILFQNFQSLSDGLDHNHLQKFTWDIHSSSDTQSYLEDQSQYLIYKITNESNKLWQDINWKFGVDYSNLKYIVYKPSMNNVDFWTFTQSELNNIENEKTPWFWKTLWNWAGWWNWIWSELNNAFLEPIFWTWSSSWIRIWTNLYDQDCEIISQSGSYAVWNPINPDPQYMVPSQIICYYYEHGLDHEKRIIDSDTADYSNSFVQNERNEASFAVLYLKYNHSLVPSISKPQLYNYLNIGENDTRINNFSQYDESFSSIINPARKKISDNYLLQGSRSSSYRFQAQPSNQSSTIDNLISIRKWTANEIGYDSFDSFAGMVDATINKHYYQQMDNVTADNVTWDGSGSEIITNPFPSTVSYISKQTDPTKDVISWDLYNILIWDSDKYHYSLSNYSNKNPSDPISSLTSNDILQQDYKRINEWGFSVIWTTQFFQQGRKIVVEYCREPSKTNPSWISFDPSIKSADRKLLNSWTNISIRPFIKNIWDSNICSVISKGSTMKNMIWTDWISISWISTSNSEDILLPVTSSYLNDQWILKPSNSIWISNCFDPDIINPSDPKYQESPTYHYKSSLWNSYQYNTTVSWPSWSESTFKYEIERKSCDSSWSSITIDSPEIKIPITNHQICSDPSDPNCSSISSLQCTLDSDPVSSSSVKWGDNIEYKLTVWNKSNSGRIYNVCVKFKTPVNTTFANWMKDDWISLWTINQGAMISWNMDQTTSSKTWVNYDHFIKDVIVNWWLSTWTAITAPMDIKFRKTKLNSLQEYWPWNFVTDNQDCNIPDNIIPDWSWSSISWKYFRGQCSTPVHYSISSDSPLKDNISIDIQSWPCYWTTWYPSDPRTSPNACIATLRPSSANNVSNYACMIVKYFKKTKDPSASNNIFYENYRSENRKNRVCDPDCHDETLDWPLNTNLPNWVIPTNTTLPSNFLDLSQYNPKINYPTSWGILNKRWWKNISWNSLATLWWLNCNWDRSCYQWQECWNASLTNWEGWLRWKYENVFANINLSNFNKYFQFENTIPSALDIANTKYSTNWFDINYGVMAKSPLYPGMHKVFVKDSHVNPDNSVDIKLQLDTTTTDNKEITISSDPFQKLLENWNPNDSDWNQLFETRITLKANLAWSALLAGWSTSSLVDWMIDVKTQLNFQKNMWFQYDSGLSRNWSPYCSIIPVGTSYGTSSKIASNIVWNPLIDSAPTLSSNSWSFDQIEQKHPLSVCNSSPWVQVLWWRTYWKDYSFEGVWQNFTDPKWENNNWAYNYNWFISWNNSSLQSKTKIWPWGTNFVSKDNISIWNSTRTKTVWQDLQFTFPNPYGCRSSDWTYVSGSVDYSWKIWLCPDWNYPWFTSIENWMYWNLDALSPNEATTKFQNIIDFTNNPIYYIKPSNIDSFNIWNWNPVIIKGQGLIFVDWDLTISSNLIYDTSSSGSNIITSFSEDQIAGLAGIWFIVKWNITISPTVSEINWLYFTLWNIATWWGGTPLTLKWGYFANKFLFQRELWSVSQDLILWADSSHPELQWNSPSERFIWDSRYDLISIPWFKEKNNYSDKKILPAGTQ